MMMARLKGSATLLSLAVLATFITLSWPFIISETFYRSPLSTSRLLMTASTAVASDRNAPRRSGISDESNDGSLESIASLQALPKIIIFDLDNTLWTPELYQIRQRHLPQADKDIRLFPDAVRILEFWCRHQERNHQGSQPQFERIGAQKIPLAIASRTSKTSWANHLLDTFRISGVPLRSLFQFVEIQTGSKKQHMSRIRQASGVPYHDMLFVDDDARMNLDEVSQLGILCCHTPRGVTVEHFVKALHRYNELRTSSDGEHPWMGHVLNSDNLNIAEPSVPTGSERAGRVKFYSNAKRFGFLVDEGTGQELFVHESKVPSGMKLQTGDKVRFQASVDSSGRASAVVLAPHPSAPSAVKSTNGHSRSASAPTASINDSAGRVTYASVSSSGGIQLNSKTSLAGESNSQVVSMPCFSMSQPFAALLLNGYKTIESRNSPMFTDWKPGTKILLHCGQRDWPDVESYKSLLPTNQPASSQVPIEQAARLRARFTKGSVIGVVTIGKTWCTADDERDSLALQRRVLAPSEGIGRYCTEIVHANWLKRPYKMRGSAGVYDVSIPLDYLPN